MDTSQTNQFLPEQSIMITNSQGTWFSKFSKSGEKLTINTSVDKKGSKKKEITMKHIATFISPILLYII